MDKITTAPYGTWQSTISARQVAAGSTPLAEPRLDGDSIYWLEGRAAEGGRMVAMRKDPGKENACLSPLPLNLRSRVHEYGGGAWAIASGMLYFSNFADKLVYAQEDDGPAKPLTRDGLQRHADFAVDTARQRLIAVREDHTLSDQETKNSLVAIAMDGSGDAILAEGFDFYAAPRLSPDGRQLAWICWNHPLMPWIGTELWLADIGDDGSPRGQRKVAGGANESFCQPLWSPDGELHVVSDRSNWWNLYRVDGENLTAICPMPSEFGRPQWVFGQAMYGFTGAHEITAIHIENGVSKLLRIDLADGTAQPIATPFSDMDGLCAGPGFVVLLAASPLMPVQVVRLDVKSGAYTVLARSAGDLPDPGYLSAPAAIDFPSSGGRVAHAFHYPPANRDYLAPAGELPPLIVFSHGGPTGMSPGILRLAYQYWTSRGFAVLDVNYGGSSGFGRRYRDALNGQWGIVDVEDCVAGARHLAAQGLADPQRMAIRGGSAGGFTTLCALTFHDTFKVGASYYGVSDLQALDDDTHKFESRYTTHLVAPAPASKALYAARSPIHHTDRLSCPIIFFQGMDDKVVPPSQSERMVDALKSRGIPTAYLTFEGEGHGFRKSETLRRTLEAELYFYAKVLGFPVVDEIEAVTIFNLP